MSYQPVSILVIEDDKNFQALIKHHFGNEINLEITYASSYLEGISAIVNYQFDLYLIDIELEGYSGFDILKILKKEKSIDNRVVVISQSKKIEDQLQAYELGASNYIIKPVDFRLIRAILNKNIRSLRTSEGNDLFVNNICINPSKRICYEVIEGNEVDIHLTPTEFNFLFRLMSSVDRVVSKDELGVLGRDMNKEMSRKSIEMQVSSIRKKIDGRKIITKREVGYIFLSNLNKR